MKKLQPLSVVLCLLTLCVIGCKGTTGKSSDSDSTKVDTLWNAKVQNIFFETPFGASKEDVIEDFAKHGFKLDKNISRNDCLYFDHYPKQVYEFGGMIWEKLNVRLVDGRFQGIEFYTPTKDKATAISNFNDIVDVVSKKYNLTEITPKDSTVIGIKKVFSKSPYVAGIVCYRYESIGKEIYYTASLFYYDSSNEEKVSDDL